MPVKQISFPLEAPESIIARIHQHMAGGFWAPYVTFKTAGNTLTITISKLGTSTLHYERTPDTGQMQYIFKDEKIALVHRPLRAEVESFILAAVEKAGARLSKS